MTQWTHQVSKMVVVVYAFCAFICECHAGDEKPYLLVNPMEAIDFLCDKVAGDFGDEKSYERKLELLIADVFSEEEQTKLLEGLPDGFKELESNDWKLWKLQKIAANGGAERAKYEHVGVPVLRAITAVALDHGLNDLQADEFVKKDSKILPQPVVSSPRQSKGQVLSIDLQAEVFAAFINVFKEPQVVTERLDNGVERKRKVVRHLPASFTITQRWYEMVYGDQSVFRWNRIVETVPTQSPYHAAAAYAKERMQYEMTLNGCDPLAKSGEKSEDMLLVYRNFLRVASYGPFIKDVRERYKEEFIDQLRTKLLTEYGIDPKSKYGEPKGDTGKAIKLTREDKENINDVFTPYFQKNLGNELTKSAIKGAFNFREGVDSSDVVVAYIRGQEASEVLLFTQVMMFRDIFLGENHELRFFEGTDTFKAHDRKIIDASAVSVLKQIKDRIENGFSLVQTELKVQGDNMAKAIKASEVALSKKLDSLSNTMEVGYKNLKDTIAEQTSVLEKSIGEVDKSIKKSKDVLDKMDSTLREINENQKTLIHINNEIKDNTNSGGNGIFGRLTTEAQRVIAKAEEAGEDLAETMAGLVDGQWIPDSIVAFDFTVTVQVDIDLNSRSLDLDVKLPSGIEFEGKKLSDLKKIISKPDLKLEPTGFLKTLSKLAFVEFSVSANYDQRRAETLTLELNRAKKNREVCFVYFSNPHFTEQFGVEQAVVAAGEAFFLANGEKVFERYVNELDKELTRLVNWTRSVSDNQTKIVEAVASSAIERIFKSGSESGDFGGVKIRSGYVPIDYHYQLKPSSITGIPYETISSFWGGHKDEAIADVKSKHPAYFVSISFPDADASQMVEAILANSGEGDLEKQDAVSSVIEKVLIKASNDGAIVRRMKQFGLKPHELVQNLQGPRKVRDEIEEKIYGKVEKFLNADVIAAFRANEAVIKELRDTSGLIRVLETQGDSPLNKSIGVTKWPEDIEILADQICAGEDGESSVRRLDIDLYSRSIALEIDLRNKHVWKTRDVLKVMAWLGIGPGVIGYLQTL